MKKVGTVNNTADAITDAVSSETLRCHVDSDAAEWRHNGRLLAQALAEDDMEGGDTYSEKSPEQSQCLQI